ncbi:MAG: LPS-assembly protein LptD, partial [Bacteroidales bacterium]|nr:LPS-assembly protein LptD [Bacteroidales bacterium]
MFLLCAMGAVRLLAQNAVEAVPDTIARTMAAADTSLAKMAQAAQSDTIARSLVAIDSSLAKLPKAVLDSTAVISQDTTAAVRDSLAPLNDTMALDSATLKKLRGTLERPAFSEAKDSVIEDMTGGRKVIYYYGDVSVTYGDMELKADYMAYDLDNNMVYARGSKDYNGEWKGLPQMSSGGTTYEMEEVYYNFNSRKARIKNMVTSQQEGELRGEKLKMLEDQSINISGGKYTVCDADHPHYYMKMTAAKVMTKPNQKTVFGPAYVVVEDVPLPLALPFGFVPSMPDRASGILIPTYGEENARGLYMRDLGYYFVLGNHFDVSITGDIYTYGSWAVRLNNRYKKRYAYDGSLAFNYSVDKTGEKGTPEYNESANFGVTWSHSQDAKARPGTSFKASVNFSSPSNNRYNTHSISEAVQNQASSSISYSKTFSGWGLSVNALHNQNSRDSSYAFTLPNISFSVSRFYPFKRKNRVGKEKAYEKFSLGYNTSFQNKINFKASEFGQPGFYDKFKNGMNHNFQIGLPNFTLLKYLNFTPSISYGMNWFFDSTKKEFDPEQNKVVDKTGGMFST